MLLAAQPGLREALYPQVDALIADPALDWQALLAASRHHRVTPLVFLGLRKHTAVPAAYRQALQTDATHNGFAAMRAAAEMRRVMSAFTAAGLPLAAIKGIVLSQLLYGSASARHVGDLDLLTRPAELPRQLDLLAGLGYRRVQPEATLTPRRLAVYTRFWKDFTLENSDAGFELDLHWRFFNHSAHPANRLLQPLRLVEVTALDVAVQTLTLEDQFLYTAAHGAGEAFTYLKTLADVAAFLNLFSQSQLDAALLRAAALDLLPIVSAAVHLSNAWMLTEARSPHLLSAAHPVARLLAGRARRLLVEQNLLPSRSHPSPASWLAYDLRLTPGPRALVEAAARFLFRPRVWSAVQLPDALFPLYPLLGLLLLPRRHDPDAGHSHAAPRTPLESPNSAGTSGVSKSPPNT